MAVEIKFEANQQYQLDAIDSVVDIFAGQEAEGSVYFDGTQGVNAGATFFGISSDQACYLFDPATWREEPITPDMVIARVKEVCAY